MYLKIYKKKTLENKDNMKIMQKIVSRNKVCKFDYYVLVYFISLQVKCKTC